MMSSLTTSRVLLWAMSWLVISFQPASVVASSAVQTVLHVNPGAQANTRLQLDLEILDSFGDPVPWGDLHMHHGRKMHVYVLHEELDLIQHIHPDDFKNLTTISTTFSVWLTFPAPGSWILHVSFVMRSNHNALGDAVSHVHQVSIDESTRPLPVGSQVDAKRKHTKFSHSSVMTITDVRTMHEAAGMIDVSVVPRHHALTVALQPPANGLWRGQCQRLHFLFESSTREAQDVRLVPFLDAAMHAFVVQHPDSDDRAKDLIHAHGFPVSMDESLSTQADESGADMCSMDMHSMDMSDSRREFEGSIVMYIRFAETGPYSLFVQVATGDQVHVARLDVVVQDVLADITFFQPAIPEKAGMKLSFSVLQPDKERKKLSVDQYVRSTRDSPCMTMTNTALTWFGSMCLSACHPGDNMTTLECLIPFPADGAAAAAHMVCRGAYYLFTAGDMVAPLSNGGVFIPIYDQRQITLNQLSKMETVQNDHAVRKFGVHPSGSESSFVGGHISKESDSPNDVDVRLTANGGKSVYAGSCVFLELSYSQKLRDGKFVEISTLQPLMRSAARVLVIPPDQSQPDLLMAHSLKESLSRPWDFLGRVIQHEIGATLWSPLDPCAEGLQRVLSPRVTGDQGGRVGQYFRFASPGTYTILSQAMFEGSSIISRHNVTVCDWKSSGFWSDVCMWTVPPRQNAHAIIEEGMDVIMDTEPAPLSSLTVSGNLAISPDLTNARLSAGTITIHKNGALKLGTRDRPFQGEFELHLNSSLHEFGPHAVSYLDVHGTLQLHSADVDASDAIVQSWTASDIKSKSFHLEESVPVAAIQAGSLVGIVSSHGEEVAHVSSNSKGRVRLMHPLQLSHGAKAIVYNLSHKIRITASGSAAIRVWNGQPDAGGSIEEKEEAFHHHRRLMRSHTAATFSPASTASHLQMTPWRSPLAAAHLMQHNSRTLLQRSSLGIKNQSDIGYQDTDIYRSSLKQQQLAGKVILHGVEIAGLGAFTQFASQAALSMEDYACPVRWPEFRKYVSLMSVAMHSLEAGCIDFQGCTGGLEIQTCLCFGSKGDGFSLKPKDVLQAPPWRIGVEDSVVHVSADAGPVHSTLSQKRPPAALLVGNAMMPTGSITHVLALSVSDSFFINPLGPAVVWTPAVPGQLHNCEARGNASSAFQFFTVCDHQSGGLDLSSAIFDGSASEPLQPSEADLLEYITAIPTDNSPVQVASTVGKSHAPMARLHIHIPPEAINIAVVLEEVRGSDKVWAALTWPTEATLWSGLKRDHQVFTGGIPCLPGAIGCSLLHNSSVRAVQSGFYNEVVDGPLRPANEEPVEFMLATKGEGVYGVGLTPFDPSKDAPELHDQHRFQVTIAAEAKRCSPGHIPVAVASAAFPDTVRWTSYGSTWYRQCVQPTQLSLNQPTRGVVLSGTVMEYFRFILPEGKRALFLMIKILYSDEPDVMLDFYATRNLLWTKRTPYETEQVTAQQLPAVRKDVDTSNLLPFEVTHVLENPPWGTYYGVISQGVRSSESKTEIEVTVIATDDMRAHELLKSRKHDVVTVLRSAQHTSAASLVSPGHQTLQMRVPMPSKHWGTADVNRMAHKRLIVEVPSGTQQLSLSIKPSSDATICASHSNWSPLPGHSKCEFESSSGLLALSAPELYGRWGTWFMSVSLQSERLPPTGSVEMHLQLKEGTCAGEPSCSGRGICMGDPYGSKWCKCEPGWYGHVCEVPATSMHGGIHTHLSHQLLLVMDNLLRGPVSADTIHVELHAPVMAATASSNELAEMYGQMFGRDICQSISIEGSDEVSNHRTTVNKTGTARNTAPETMEPHSADGAGSQPAATQPPLPSSNSNGKAKSSPSRRSGGASHHDPDGHRPRTASTRPKSYSTDTRGIDGSEEVPHASQVFLILPGTVACTGGVPGVPYGSAMATSVDMKDTGGVQQSLVLVTAYSLQVRGANSSDSTVSILALCAALTSQVHHDAGEGPQVHVVPAYTHPPSKDHTGNATGARRRLFSGSAAVPSHELMAGVVIDRLSDRQRAVLQDRLADTAVVSKIWRVANENLRGSGTSIANLTPGLIVPSLLLTVNCTESEACGMDAAQWADTVHAAAEAQHLQQPDDVWVFDAGAAGLVPVSEDFHSVELSTQRVFPWHALMFWGGATLAAAFVALAVYVSISRSRWHQPRNKMWEGYTAVGGPAGAVGEGVNATSVPFGMSDLSPMSRGSVHARLTRKSSVVDYYRGIMGYGQLAPVEQSWSDTAGQASSLMHQLVVCRETDDELPGTTTMPSLPSGISFDSQQLRSVARTSATGVSLAHQISTGSSHQLSTASGADTDSIMKPVRQSLFQLTGRRTTQNCGAELPELHVSCTPSTEHLPAYKAWMKGGLSTKHGDWLSARRWSVLMRSGEASSLSEAIDLSLSSMNASASLAPPEAAPGGASVMMPSSKLAVIAELPHGAGANESDEMHALQCDLSEAFPRASRQASATTATVHLLDEAEGASGGALSATEATSARDVSSAHESRWDVEGSTGDKGSPSTVDVPSNCASQDAQLREELGICRAGNTGVSCILQARTHQWVSGMSTGDLAPEFPNERTPLRINGSPPPPPAGAQDDSLDVLYSPIHLRMPSVD